MRTVAAVEYGRVKLMAEYLGDEELNSNKMISMENFNSLSNNEQHLMCVQSDGPKMGNEQTSQFIWPIVYCHHNTTVWRESELSMKHLYQLTQVIRQCHNV